MSAATRQNQQSDCAPSEDSDQPGHPPSLISVFAVRMKKARVLSYPLSAQQRLIRLGGCPGWSESSLGAQSLCWFCHVTAHVLLCALWLPFLSLSSIFIMPTVHSSIWAVTWQNQQSDCAPREDSGQPSLIRTQISLGICPVWSESSLSA